MVQSWGWGCDSHANIAHIEFLNVERWLWRITGELQPPSAPTTVCLVITWLLTAGLNTLWLGTILLIVDWLGTACLFTPQLDIINASRTHIVALSLTWMDSSLHVALLACNIHFKYREHPVPGIVNRRPHIGLLEIAYVSAEHISWKYLSENCNAQSPQWLQNYGNAVDLSTQSWHSRLEHGNQYLLWNCFPQNCSVGVQILAMVGFNYRISVV